MKVPQTGERELQLKLAEAFIAHRNLHPVYGSTSACGGGIGGQTLTEHCAQVCQNPKHDEAREAWNQIESWYFENYGKQA